MREIKYRVTDSFGEIEEDDIINSLLAWESPPVNGTRYGLAFHPPMRNECSSLELVCLVDKKHDIWEAAGHEEQFVNIEGRGSKAFNTKMLPDTKWIRKFYVVHRKQLKEAELL